MSGTMSTMQKRAREAVRRDLIDSNDPYCGGCGEALLVQFATAEVEAAVRAERERMQRVMADMMRSRTERDIEPERIERRTK